MHPEIRLESVIEKSTHELISWVGAATFPIPREFLESVVKVRPLDSRRVVESLRLLSAAYVIRNDTALRILLKDVCRESYTITEIMELPSRWKWLPLFCEDDIEILVSEILRTFKPRSNNSARYVSKHSFLSNSNGERGKISTKTVYEIIALSVDPCEGMRMASRFFLDERMEDFLETTWKFPFVPTGAEKRVRNTY